MLDDPHTYPLAGRFLMGRLRGALSEAEKATVEALFDEVEQFDAPYCILSRGEVCDKSTMLVEGLALRTIELGNRRYVVGVQVPGDFVDLHCFALKRLDHDLVTVGPTRVAYARHGRIEELMRSNAHLARLLWFSTLLDAAIHREWILKLEQLRASERVAHIFCEIWKRLEFVGLAAQDGIHTPLIQSDLADMCGTTAIHMNRALSQLRQEGIADFQRGRLYVPSRARLEEYAHFDPTYLYGEGVLEMRGELDQ